MERWRGAKAVKLGLLPPHSQRVSPGILSGLMQRAYGTGMRRVRYRTGAEVEVPNPTTLQGAPPVVVEYRFGGSGGLGTLIAEHSYLNDAPRTSPAHMMVRTSDDRYLSLPARAVTFRFPPSTSASQLSFIEARVANLLETHARDPKRIRRIHRLYRDYAHAEEPAPCPVKAAAALLFGSEAPLETYAAYRVLGMHPALFKRHGAEFMCHPMSKILEGLETPGDTDEKESEVEDPAVAKGFLLGCKLRRVMEQRRSDKRPLESTRRIKIHKTIPKAYEPYVQSISNWNFDAEDLWLLDRMKKNIALGLTVTDSEVVSEDTQRMLGAVAKLSTHRDAYRLLHKLGIIGSVDELEPYHHDVNPVFPPAVLQAVAELIQKPPPEKLDRVDLRDMPAYAIDTMTSIEKDDAFSVQETAEGTWIYVHIADPSRYIEAHSAVDTFIQKRLRSAYLPGGLKIPLLPPALSAAAALSSERFNHAITFAVKLDKLGKLQDSHIMPSLISPVVPLTIQSADLYLSKSEDPSSAKSPLRRAFELASLRREWRIDRGAQFLDLPSVRAKNYVLPTEPLKTGGVPSTGATMLVEEMMLLAGETAAQFAYNQGLPFIYRGQARPKNDAAYFEHLMNPYTKDQGIAKIWRLRSLTEPPQYSTYHQSHFSLALDSYAQVTSPLRRAMDIQLHRQLKMKLADETCFSAHEMNGYLINRSTRLKAMDELDLGCERRWALAKLAKLKEEPQKALVLDVWQTKADGSPVAKPRATVLLSHLPWRTTVDVPHHVKRGQSLYFAVEVVDPEANILTLRTME